MKLRRFANSLVVRVVFLAICITLAGTFLRFTLMSQSLHQGIEELVAAHLSSQANYVAADIDQKILVRKQLLETLARQLPLPLLGQPRELTAWLAERQALAPHFSLGMAVLPVSGQGIIADYPPLPGRHELDFSANEWFRTACDQAKFALGKPGIGRVSGQGLIIMAAPVLDAGGHVRAVIQGVTQLDAPGFLSHIQNNRIGETGGFLLVSPRDRLFVAASQPAMRLQPTPLAGVNRLHDRAMAGWRGSGITVNAQGIEEIVAVSSVPGADWFVVARMPTSEAFQPVSTARQLLVQKGGSLSLLALALFAFFLFYLFRPLREAARQVHQMADGQLPLSALPVVRHDEVGEMVSGFNFVVARVLDNEARMIELAHRDELTGLPNRLSFRLQAEQTVSLIRRQQGKLALMFIDLDGFKPINDQYGHETGDLLLQQVAARLSEGLRQADMVARFGGDEFVVLLSGLGDQQAAARLAEKLIASLSLPYWVNDREMLIGASIGIAFLPEDGEDIETLIAQADAAMYDAKHAGRNCCRFARRVD